MNNLHWIGFPFLGVIVLFLYFSCDVEAKEEADVTVTGKKTGPQIGGGGVRLSETNLELLVGESTVLEAEVTSGNSSNRNVSWSSSNESVVEVDNAGNVTGVSVGKALINASLISGSRASCFVEVVQEKAVRLKQKRINLVLNSPAVTKALSPVFRDLSDDVSRWESSDVTVARVDGSGVATGYKVGRAVITVRAKSGGKATCDVYVYKESGGLEISGNAVVGIGTETGPVVVIPAQKNGVPITTIGYRAFNNCKNLKEVIIPDSITKIGAHAFSYSSLNRIKIPRSVTTIEPLAFHMCSSLEIYCSVDSKPSGWDGNWMDLSPTVNAFWGYEGD